MSGDDALRGEPRIGTIDHGGSSLAVFLAFLIQRRRWFLLGTGIPTLAMLIYSILVPVEYRAQAVLLPSSSASSSLLTAAQAVIGSRFGSLDLQGGASELEIQEAILRSRRMADAMDQKFGLSRRYGTKKRDARLLEWYGLLKTGTNKQGLLTVSYQDRDPAFAAEVVAGLVEELDRFNRESRISAGRRVREFLERRLAETQLRLRAVEDSLVTYQSTHHTLVLTGESGKALEGSESLLIEKVRLETELQVLRKSLGPDAPALRAKESEITALNRELSRLPGLTTNVAVLLRSRQVLERTFAFLSAQLEEAKIQEARDTPTLDLLDPPLPPDQKSWPKRSILVLTAFTVSFLLTLLAIKGLELVRAATRPRVSVRG